MPTQQPVRRVCSLDAPPSPGVLMRADGAEFTLVARHADAVE